MSEGSMIRREFAAELLPSGDGRTLDVRIIPYNSVTRVSDRPGEFYDEEWLPGAFDRQLAAPNRVDVLANFEHQQGISGVIARGTELRDSDAALEGTFRMLSHSDADKALELVNEGVLTGVSVEAVPLKSERVDGVVKRVKARLVNIALCRSPAFAEAQVLAVREAGDEPEAPAPEPEPDPEPEVPSSDVAEALQRVGFQPLVIHDVVSKPWDSTAARFTDEEYAHSCLIDRGGDGPAKERCALPVLEPNGDLNTNALERVERQLGHTRASTAQKAAAARLLVRYYRQAGMDPPARLRSIAAR